jgi:hemerythrin
LVEFASDHFYHEEQLQLKYRFPSYEKNKQKHQEFLTKMKAIIYCPVEKADTTQEKVKKLPNNLTG